MQRASSIYTEGCYLLEAESDDGLVDWISWCV